MKVKEKAQIVVSEKLTEGIYSLLIATKASEYAVPGQFQDSI